MRSPDVFSIYKKIVKNDVLSNEETKHNHVVYGTTLLHTAALFGRFPVVKAFLSQGSSIDEKSPNPSFPWETPRTILLLNYFEFLKELIDDDLIPIINYIELLKVLKEEELITDIDYVEFLEKL